MSAASYEPGCNAPGGSDTDAGASGPIVVLGIGNVLWSDEGFGVRCVEALQARYEFAPQVRLVDGGTQGLYLLPQVQQASRLLVFDAVDYGMPPGTLKVVADEEVPRFLGARKMSLHQTGFQEVLMLAQLTGRWPERVLLVGCQPEVLDDFGGSLRPVVKQALEGALQVALGHLEQWGAEPLARSVPPGDADAVTAPSRALGAYEDGRPSAEAACRIGDPRVLSMSAGR